MRHGGVVVNPRNTFWMQCICQIQANVHFKHHVENIYTTRFFCCWDFSKYTWVFDHKRNSVTTLLCRLWRKWIVHAQYNRKSGVCVCVWTAELLFMPPIWWLPHRQDINPGSGSHLWILKRPKVVNHLNPWFGVVHLKVTSDRLEVILQCRDAELFCYGWMFSFQSRFKC